ncbi:MAG TPA: D-lyxose/D-mannose family sugar isomerase [Fimbriimonadaceae bacterium]|nr:D-lyxose/D-mannose family sugar isomerase [Fimbriimonadaceae bacterium]
MKRSEINYLIRCARKAFRANGWALPPNPRWDVTDLGLGDWRKVGLVLVNLAEEPEYCEKLMYAQRGMTTPPHTHRLKKEDIICRAGYLSITVWNGPPRTASGSADVKICGEPQTVPSGTTLTLGPGERVTLVPGVWHSFVPLSEECVIGEVSTANDDVSDNVFDDPAIGRFPEIEEDEPGTVRLVSEL